MLIGCGCNCAEDSVSSVPSAVSLSESSVQFPSQSTWPNSTEYSGDYGQSCLACIGGVRPLDYKVTILGMQQQQPTIFGDWACVEMLQQPFRVGAENWNGTIPISGINSANCTYGSSLASGGNPPAIGDPVDCSKVYQGFFHPNTSGTFFPCGPWPVCDLMFKTTTEPVTLEPLHQVLLRLSFYGYGPCSPSFIPPLTHYLAVDYASPLQYGKHPCLNSIPLYWQTAFGNYERQNPDGGGWESYGVGPGNNRSYQFHRGDFPEIISIRPWGT